MLFTQHGVPLGHLLPQAPQLFESPTVLTHVPPHAVVPIGQPHVPLKQIWPMPHVVPFAAGTHIPMEQVSQTAHVRPHMPQFWLVLSGVSQPSAATPLQSAKPGSQLTILHVPMAQVDIAFGSMQTLLQAPQLWSSVCVFTQVPLQTVWPGRQVHIPPTQSWVALQTRPQAPQLSWFVVRFTHIPLQEVKGGRQAIEQTPLVQV
jgi:hypothetical protein